MLFLRCKRTTDSRVVFEYTSCFFAVDLRPIQESGLFAVMSAHLAYKAWAAVSVSVVERGL